MNESFMKEKPVLPLVLSMSLPMVLSMMVNALYNIVDTYFVAKISEDAVTALSLVFPVQNLVNAAAIGFGVGVNAVIALRRGAGRTEDADRAAAQALTLSAIHSVVLAAASLLLMPPFLRMFRATDAVQTLGLEYSTVVFAFAPAIMFGLVFEKIYQAVGRMNVSMVALALGCAANIALDPIMIFGLGPVPAMGIRGAALATGLGQVISLAVYLIVGAVRPLPVRIRRKHLRLDRGTVRALYAVGVPAALNLALPSLMISALNAILAAFSETGVLVLGIYYKLQTFLYLPANGFVQGMRPLVGYNYGAGEYKRVSRILRLVLLLSGAIMAAGTVACACVPDRLIALFSQSDETVRLGARALRIISAGFVVSAVSVTVCGALEGLGKGAASLIISLCRYAVIILPAAFVLSRFWGADGVWHAFWVAEALTAGVSVLVYRRATDRSDAARP